MTGAECSIWMSGPAIRPGGGFALLGAPYPPLHTIFPREKEQHDDRRNRPIGDIPVERIARTLAGLALSKNGEGDLSSASEAVDALWPDYTASALAALKAIREPSAAMLAVGDAELWDRMINAAIDDETISD